MESEDEDERPLDLLELIEEDDDDEEDDCLFRLFRLEDFFLDSRRERERELSSSFDVFRLSSDLFECLYLVLDLDLDLLDLYFSYLSFLLE